MSLNINRRIFIKKGVATATGIGILSNASTISRAEKIAASVMSNAMPKRKLGKTGLKVSLLGLGGQSTIQHRDKSDEAIEIINRAIDLGVNYIDTAPIYGISEKNIGEVMKQRRNEVILASKSNDRTYSGTMRLFEQSLRNLQTDYIDLYQIHDLRRLNHLSRVFQINGALRAFQELKSQGSIRFLGITGHYDPTLLKTAIEHFDFDCILMSLNAADIHYLPFQNDLLCTAMKKNLGIIAMKVTARGNIFRYDGITSMEQALRYTYSLPVSTAIVGITSIDQLEENVKITRNFQRYNEQELKYISQLTSHYFRKASYFKK
jgi:uncharacterized protein